MRQWLAPAHLALTLVILVWNVVLAGRIAQLRQASKPFAALTGLVGLLLIPAFIVAVATTTLISGRAIASIDWIWPLTVVLVATQAVYALSQLIAEGAGSERLAALIRSFSEQVARYTRLSLRG